MLRVSCNVNFTFISYWSLFCTIFSIRRISRTHTHIHTNISALAYSWASQQWQPCQQQRVYTHTNRGRRTYEGMSVSVYRRKNQTHSCMCLGEMLRKKQACDIGYKMIVHFFGSRRYSCWTISTLSWHVIFAKAMHAGRTLCTNKCTPCNTYTDRLQLRRVATFNWTTITATSQSHQELDYFLIYNPLSSCTLDS